MICTNQQQQQQQLNNQLLTYVFVSCHFRFWNGKVIALVLVHVEESRIVGKNLLCRIRTETDIRSERTEHKREKRYKATLINTETSE